MRFLRLAVALVFLTLSLSVQGQMSMRWSKRFNMPGWTMFPVDVAIDAVGNVYTVAERHEGLPSKVVVSKFGPTGAFVWSRRFDLLQGASHPRIEVTRNSQVYVSYRHEVSQTYISVVRLSTETGAVLWQKFLEGETNSDLLLRDQDGSPVAIVSLFTSPAAQPPRIRAEILGSDGQLLGRHVYYPPVSSWGSWDFTRGVIYGDQFAYVAGKQRNDGDLSPCRLLRVGLNGSIRSSTELSYTGHLAYSPVSGGRLLTAGKSGAATLRLQLLHAQTGQLLDESTDFFPSSVSIRAWDAVADPSGSLYVVGEDDTNGSVSNPFCHRYSFPGLTRLWAATGIAETQEVRFEHAELDPFGTLFAVSIGSNAGARVYGIDTASGRSMGVAASPANPGFGSYHDTLAVNALGMAGHAISELVDPDSQLTVQMVRPVGILNVVLPVTELTGGSSTTGTLRVYLPIATARSIRLSSSSEHVQVPATRTIAANQGTVTFPVTTTVPSTDHVVTLIADDGRSRRSVRFLLRRP